ncbi:MAG: DUF1552 domain-containing protein [Archangiaceae bacterium]|nr:DUF1552 domain-containing protein [Archangiaceae bacterium]
MNFDRRTLLKALAVAPVLGARRALAGPEWARPRNLVVVYHPNGLEPGWKPAMTNGALTFPSTLQALQPFASRCLAVYGLVNGVRNEVAAHAQGMTSLWTGAVIPKDDAYSTWPSIDQLAAPVLSTGSPLASLELGVQSQAGFGAGDNQSVMIYGGAGKLQPEDDPSAAFRRAFGAAGSDASRVRAERKSVIDYVRQDIARVRSGYGTAEQFKLDAHLEGLRQLEQRLDALAGLTCNATAPSQLGAGALGATENFDTLATAQVDLLSTALRCGLTRVASLQLSNSISDRRITGVNPSLGVHATMHAGTRADKVLINRYFAGVVARLLQKLDSTKFSDGHSLLDETLVVWGTEMAIGNHLKDPVPFIVAGGDPAMGYFKQNQLLELASPSRTTRLLLSVLEACGVPSRSTLGDLKDELSTGTLPGASRVTA